MFESIREYIALGEIQLALNSFKEFLAIDKRHNLVDECIILIGRHTTNEQKNRQGVIQSENYNIERNKISVDLLNFLQQVEEVERARCAKIEEDKKKGEAETERIRLAKIEADRKQEEAEAERIRLAKIEEEEKEAERIRLAKVEAEKKQKQAESESNDLQKRLDKYKYLFDDSTDVAPPTKMRETGYTKILPEHDFEVNKKNRNQFKLLGWVRNTWGGRITIAIIILIVAGIFMPNSQMADDEVNNSSNKTTDEISIGFTPIYNFKKNTTERIIRLYKVKPNQTTSWLINHYGMTSNEFVILNPSKKKSAKLITGEHVKIYDKVTYKMHIVDDDETLDDIRKQYVMYTDEIARLNNVSTNYLVKKDEKLKVFISKIRR